MESILRSKEMAEIKLLPVRHHSPACSFHVLKTIEDWKPDAILIEGPDSVNEWIPVMVHEDTKAPFAVYYSYDDVSGIVSVEKEKYKCYYPFLDYSPELVALRSGYQQGIYTAFIDMPYGEILAASKEGKGLLKEAEKSNYNDDYLLSRSSYVQALCEKTGMRSFDEFWEKYFEIEGLYQDSEKWFENLLTHCRLSRESSSEEELRMEGCLQREEYMAKQILSILDKRPWEDGQKELKNSRILVVTGGFHTPALATLLESLEKSPNPKKKVPAKDQGVFLMPYSMEGADALNGYASGMPFAGFYQDVWESLMQDAKELGKKAYESTVLDTIVRCGKRVRSKDGGISTYDEICACAMAKGLADLRGKREPGAYELQDTILSNFVKGEYTIATDLPMRVLRKLMTGRQIGELCANANEPPILQDFRTQCKRFGLKIASTTQEEVILSVFSKKKHRQISMLLHRIMYLGADFARRLKGPDLQTGRDRNLMREIWKYKWSPQVMASLIESSVYGASIEEAVLGMVKQELKQDLSTAESTLLLTRVFEMGLESQLETVYGRVYELVLQDTDFYSLTEGLRTLVMLQELCELYQSGLQLQELLGVCCRKVIGLLPVMTRIKEEDMTACMEALKSIYQVTGRNTMLEASDLRECFYQALQQMKEEKEIQTGIHGCIYGILYGSALETPESVIQVCKGYLGGTKEQMMNTAFFFRGLFFAAKDLVFVGESFLKMLDEFLGRMDMEDFLRLLPQMRMAFTYFTPSEVDRIAETAAGFHGRKRGDILEKKAILPEVYTYGNALDTYVREQLLKS